MYKIKMLILVTALSLFSLLLPAVKAKFIYTIPAITVKATSGIFEISSWNYYYSEIPSESQDGKLNQKLLETILGGNSPSEGLTASDSLINKVLTWKTIKDYDFYLTSEDYISINNKLCNLREYFKQPKNIYFVILRKEKYMAANQTYYIFSTTASAKKGIISPIYRTTLTWKASGRYPFETAGIYSITETLVGTAPATKIKSRNPNSFGKSINFFDFANWSKS